MEWLWDNQMAAIERVRDREQQSFAITQQTNMSKSRPNIHVRFCNILQCSRSFVLFETAPIFQNDSYRNQYVRLPRLVNTLVVLCRYLHWFQYLSIFTEKDTHNKLMIPIIIPSAIEQLVHFKYFWTHLWAFHQTKLGPEQWCLLYCTYHSGLLSKIPGMRLFLFRGIYLGLG